MRRKRPWGKTIFREGNAGLLMMRKGLTPELVAVQEETLELAELSDRRWNLSCIVRGMVSAKTCFLTGVISSTKRKRVP